LRKPGTKAERSVVELINLVSMRPPLRYPGEKIVYCGLNKLGTNKRSPIYK
jgi:hypothetical protein